MQARRALYSGCRAGKSVKLHKDAPWDAPPYYLTADVNPRLHNLGQKTDKRQKQKTPYLAITMTRIQSFRGIARAVYDFTQALRGSEQLLADVRLSVAHGFGAHFITVGQAMGADELDVGDAEEAEQHFQIIFVRNTGCLTGMQTTGSRDDHDFLAAAQTFRAGFGVAESLTGHGDAVDPGLELGRNSDCLLYTSPSPRDRTRSRMPSSA